MQRKRDGGHVERASTYKQIVVDSYWLAIEEDVLRYVLGTNTVRTGQAGKEKAELLEGEIILSRSIVESMKKEFESWLEDKKKNRRKKK